MKDHQVGGYAFGEEAPESMKSVADDKLGVMDVYHACVVLRV